MKNVRVLFPVSIFERLDGQNAHCVFSDEDHPICVNKATWESQQAHDRDAPHDRVVISTTVARAAPREGTSPWQPPPPAVEAIPGLPAPAAASGPPVQPAEAAALQQSVARQFPMRHHM